MPQPATPQSPMPQPATPQSPMPRPATPPPAGRATTTLLIRIDNCPGGQRVTVRGFVVEEAAGSWGERLEAQDVLDRDLSLFDRAPGAVRSPRPAGAPEPGQVGRDLWDLVVGRDVGTWWKAAVAAADGSTVRTVLDIRIPALTSVPWELMTPGPGRAPVFRSGEHPWVRAHTTPWPAPGDIPAPVTVLVVVGSTDPDLQADDEIAAVYGALRHVPGLWNVEVLVAPGKQEFHDTLAEISPDVLHVIAHGLAKGTEHVLEMGGPAGRWALRTEDVDVMARPMPRLVVLNACRTGTGSSSEGHLVARAFTDALIERGAAAVVTMQGDITSPAAADFSGTLYAELADGAAVDVASAQARRAVNDLARDGSDGGRCWALPSLTVAADPDRILPMGVCRADRERVTRSPFAHAFRDVRTYVDRTSERRALWRALDPAPGCHGKGLVLVTGGEHVGKSSMVLSALMTLRLRGCNVVYVDLTPPPGLATKLRWLAVLRRIRDAVHEWVPDLSGEAIGRFNHDLAFLRRYRDPDPWITGAPTPRDDDCDFPTGPDDLDVWIRQVFISFRQMLVTAAGDRPLLLVLDGLNAAFGEDVTQWLSPELLEPIGHPTTHPLLRCVLVGTPRELEPLTRTARDLARVDEIGLFRKAELTRLTREFYARTDVAVQDASWWPKVHQLVADASNDVTPANLRQFLVAAMAFSVSTP